MTFSLKPLLLAAALGLSAAGIAAAQPAPQHPAPEQSAQPADHHGMPGMGEQGMEMSRMDRSHMDMSAMHCAGLSRARLDALRAELGITPRQLRAWNAFAATQMAGRPGGMDMSGMDMSGGMAMMSGSLPERLARHEKMMRAHLQTLARVKAAVSRLYAVLTPGQRAKADRALCPGMM